MPLAVTDERIQKVENIKGVLHDIKLGLGDLNNELYNVATLDSNNGLDVPAQLVDEQIAAAYAAIDNAVGIIREQLLKRMRYVQAQQTIREYEGRR